MTRAGSPPLPSFIVAGASRSGTTSIYDYLSRHPSILLGQPKEVRFFDRDAEYSKGLESYRKAFAAWRDEQAVGEASPSYFQRGVRFDASGGYAFDPADDAARRIRRDLPDVRVILSLRHPIERAYSIFWKHRQQGRERLADFRAVLEHELSGGRRPERDPGCLFYKNRYALHLAHWIDLFGADRVKVLVFEEWTRRPAECFTELAEWLGVDGEPMAGLEYGVRNRGWTPRSRVVARALPRLGRVGRLLRSANRAGYPPMDEATAAFAHELFADEIAATERLLGREIGAWHAAQPALSR